MSFPKIKTTYYPESDGRPMGETDEHRDAMVRIIELLKIHFQDQHVYVSGDLLLYYEQGNPKKFVVPDAFIAKGLKQKRRRIYRMWVEGIVPQLVIETTSKKTKKKDTVEKPELYARLGIHEYFLHDPTSDYLDPPLQGYRLRDGKYDRIEADSHGNLWSEELGLLLRIEDDELNLFHPVSNERLLTNQERMIRESEARQREAEARQLETEARQRAELEVERLRAELAKYQSR
jgi:Uma2 family endonuclease